MSILVPFNGSTYIIPTPNEIGWGTNLDNYFVAIAQGCLQNIGGSFTLSAETDFGGAFGLKSLYYKSRSTNPASTGPIRLANNVDGIYWRDSTNMGDHVLTVSNADVLTFDGVPLSTGGSGTVSPGLANTLAYYPSSSNLVDSLTAITASKALVSDSNGLPVASLTTDTEVGAIHGLTASKALETDGAGLITTSAVTSTELGYVSGVTSSIQNQFASIMQGGIPIWDSLVTYSIGSYVRKTGTVELYASLVNSNVNNALPNQVSDSNWLYIQQGNPTGTILDFGGTAAPAGYLLCDGSAVSRTTYVNLFNVIGIAFGPGDTTTTFNLPDGRGTVLAGKTSGGSFPTLGATVGSETHTQTQSAHSHTVDSHTHTIAHRHPSPACGANPANVANARTDGAGWSFGTSSIGSNQVGSVSATATTTETVFLNTGDSSAPDSGSATPGTDSQTPSITNGSSIQPTLVVNKIIKF